MENKIKVENEMKFKTIYNYKSPKGIVNKSVSMTQAQFQDECDINKIMDRYFRTGCLSDPLSRMKPGTYGDFTNMGDYMENMNKIIQAREMFDALPAKVRERFGNNPGAMIDFVMDPANQKEAIELGLLEVKEVKETIKETINEIKNGVNSGTESSSTTEDGNHV